MLSDLNEPPGGKTGNCLLTSSLLESHKNFRKEIMGFFHQLKILLWKNFTLKKRAPLVVLFEISIPLVLFVIVLLIRLKQRPTKQAVSYHHTRPLPSAGVISIMQAFCDNGVKDEHGFLNYPNSTVPTFLKQFDNVSRHNNFFNPGFSPEEMDTIPDMYRSIIEDPIAIHDKFTHAQDFSLDKIFSHPVSVDDFLMHNLSMPRDEAMALMASTVNTSEIYRMLFGDNLLDDTGNRLLKTDIHDTPHKDLPELITGAIYEFISGDSQSKSISQASGILTQLLGLREKGTSGPLSPSQVVDMLKMVLLSPKSLHEVACDKIEVRRLLIPAKPEDALPLSKSQAYICGLNSTQLTELSNNLSASISDNNIINIFHLGDMNVTSAQQRIKEFAHNLKNFALFERNMIELSALAANLPANGCHGDKEGNSTLNTSSSTISPGTTEPSTEDNGKIEESGGQEKIDRKPSKYAGLLQLWFAMQDTVCGNPNTITPEKMDEYMYSDTLNLKDMGLSSKQQRDVGILVHVLYSNPKVLYAPNTTAVSSVMTKANESFALVDTISQYAEEWLNANESFALVDTISQYAEEWLNVSSRLRTYLLLNSTARNLKQMKKMQDQMKNLPDFFTNFANPDITNFAQNVTIYDQKTFLHQLDIVDNAACAWRDMVSGISFNIFRGFATEEELVYYVLNEAYHNNETVLASLVFETKEDGSLPPHVTYKIRQNASFTESTKLIRPKYWYPGPKDWGFSYYYFGFVWIQDIIERAIIAEFVGHDITEPGAYIQVYPYPCYMNDEFLFMIEHVMPLCLTISWVYTVAMLVQSVVYEKEQRLKEVMKMMGLNNSVHWVAWFMTSFLQMSVTMAILTAMLKYGNVLSYSNPLIIFLVLEMFAVATIAFSFLVSVCYSKAKLAAACAGIIYFLTYVPYMYVAIREEAAGDRIAAWAKSIASLMSTTAFGLGSKYFAYYEIEGIGVQWNNIYISPVENDQYNLLSVCLMMMFDCILYFILVWYIEHVHPGSYGLPKPWYFPFLRSYWCGHVQTEAEQCSWRNCLKGRRNLSVMEEDQACAVNQQHNEIYMESEPTHLQLGLEIDNLSKVYKNGKQAVNKLSLNLYEDQITSFLGHNGAGKTTTMSIITGLFPPTSGYATIYGKDIRTEMEEIRKSLGMCPQHNVLFDKLTVEEHLWFYARLKDMKTKDINREMDSIIADVGLPDKRKTNVENLSGGMQRKLSVAIAFVAGSRTVILDEPTAGVDPYARRAIWDLLLKYKKGRTILLSTHHMDEADLLGDRIAIISSGQLKCCGSPIFLKNSYGDGYHLILVKKMVQIDEEGEGSEFVFERDSAPVHSLDTECDSSAVTTFINKHMQSAYLQSETQQELHYVLPFQEAKKGHFEKLFTGLEKSLDELHLSSFGVMDTTLEEVFLKVNDQSSTLEEEREKEAELKSLEQYSLDKGEPRAPSNRHRRNISNVSNISQQSLTNLPFRYSHRRQFSDGSHGSMGSLTHLPTRFYSNGHRRQRSDVSNHSVSSTIGLLGGNNYNNLHMENIGIVSGNHGNQDTMEHSQVRRLRRGHRRQHSDTSAGHFRHMNPLGFRMEAHDSGIAGMGQEREDIPKYKGENVGVNNEQNAIKIQKNKAQDREHVIKDQEHSVIDKPHTEVAQRDQAVEDCAMLTDIGHPDDLRLPMPADEPLLSSLHRRQFSNGSSNSFTNTLGQSDTMLLRTIGNSGDHVPLRTIQNNGDTLPLRINDHDSDNESLVGQPMGQTNGGYSRLPTFDPTAANPEPVICDGKGSYKVTKKELLFQQFIAIIVKRFFYIRRNWKGLFSQILLPALFICIAMTVALTAPQVKDLPSLELSPSQYFNLTQPRGNFIPFSNVAAHGKGAPPLKGRYAKTSPEALIQTLHLPSGVGATCVLKKPFNNSFDVDILKTLNTTSSFHLLQKYFEPKCQHVFERGLPLENFVPPVPKESNLLRSRRLLTNETIVESDEPKKTEPRYYPSCTCAEDNSGFICENYGYQSAPRFSCVTSDILVDITGQNESEYYLKTTDEYRLHRYGSFAFGHVRDYVPLGFGESAPALFKKLAVRNVSKVWYFNKGYHSVPTYLNVLNNAILRANLPKSMGNPAAYGITVINHPMNNTNNQLSMDVILQGSDALISIFIIVAMSFVPASFVLFLVYERSIKAKHLQFVSGINPVIYWLANYIWDMCNYVIPAVCCIVILKIFDIPAYVSANNFPAVISLFLLYGWSITPMMYPVSFRFEEPSSAYIFLIVINLFVGITCIVTSFLLELFQYDKELSRVHDVLKCVFLLFPNYSLGRGLMDVAFNEYRNDYFFKTGQYDQMKSPFEWNLMARNLVAMACMGCIFFIITLICEYNFFRKQKCLPVSTHIPVVNGEDADVAAERRRVLRGTGRNDIIRLENLTKVYHTRKLGSRLAVDRLCLGVPQGECFGLLGVNGAGKTTTFKMLTGDVGPTSGNAFMNGHSIQKDLLKVQQNVGYCPQFDALYDELTGREHLTLYARLRGIPLKEEKQVVEWALNKLALSQYADKPSGTYSGGNKRKLSTAIALLGNPPVIFLDEPTTGMDPHSKRFLWDLILDLVKGGRSIILTSHSMEECEALCTRLAIMVNGKFKCMGSIQHLKNRFGDGYTVSIRVKGPSFERNILMVQRYFDRNFPEAVPKELHHNIVQYELGSSNLSLADVFAKMEEIQRELEVEDYSVCQNTLDNVFINFVKQQADLVQETGGESCDQSCDQDEDYASGLEQGRLSFVTMEVAEA
ncbi:unnamed protein product [Owenia fusiformis]|uniref:ATP-binding cassette sub-family A member 2 n=1 Tax=Owenia fusiformis TaxID=6347 RepID=A0A8J1Y2T1_OWEFU|nr:unnamed protein product [Owenia fusiformis]